MDSIWQIIPNPPVGQGAVYDVVGFKLWRLRYVCYNIAQGAAAVGALARVTIIQTKPVVFILGAFADTVVVAAGAGGGPVTWGLRLEPVHAVDAVGFNSANVSLPDVWWDRDLRLDLGFSSGDGNTTITNINLVLDVLK